MKCEVLWSKFVHLSSTYLPLNRPVTTSSTPIFMATKACSLPSHRGRLQSPAPQPKCMEMQNHAAALVMHRTTSAGCSISPRPENPQLSGAMAQPWPTELQSWEEGSMLPCWLSCPIHTYNCRCMRTFFKHTWSAAMRQEPGAGQMLLSGGSRTPETTGRRCWGREESWILLHRTSQSTMLRPWTPSWSILYIDIIYRSMYLYYIQVNKLNNYMRCI